MIRTTVEERAHRANWLASDLTKEIITVDLSANQQALVDQIVAELGDRDFDLQTLAKMDFPIDEVAREVRAIADEVLYGRGIVIVRGWPIGRYSISDICSLFLTYGRLLGEPVVQNGRGDRLVHVRDLNQATQRVSTSNRGVMLHSDLEAIVGLLSLQKAKSGGVSTIASARAIHNRIAEARPDLLVPLYQGYRFYWRGDTDERPINTDYFVPVFSEDGGQINVFMQRGLENSESEIAREALEYFIEVAQSPDLIFSFTLEPGEASIMCNYSVLHARDAFEDWQEPERRRHLLRLWLSVPDERRPIHANLRRLYHDAFSDAVRPNDGRM